MYSAMKRTRTLSSRPRGSYTGSQGQLIQSLVDPYTGRYQGDQGELLWDLVRPYFFTPGLYWGEQGRDLYLLVRQLIPTAMREYAQNLGATRSWVADVLNSQRISPWFSGMPMYTESLQTRAAQRYMRETDNDLNYLEENQRRLDRALSRRDPRSIARVRTPGGYSTLRDRQDTLWTNMFSEYID